MYSVCGGCADHFTLQTTCAHWMSWPSAEACSGRLRLTNSIATLLLRSSSIRSPLSTDSICVHNMWFSVGCGCQVRRGDNWCIDQGNLKGKFVDNEIVVVFFSVTIGVGLQQRRKIFNKDNIFYFLLLIKAGVFSGPGRFDRGLYHGVGTLTYGDGWARYIGGWRYGKRHTAIGETAIWIDHNGDKYNVPFVDDFMGGCRYICGISRARH